MTRINSGIEVKTLCDQHLIAEHRELPRIPNCIKKGRYSLVGQPKEFTLGTGHVRWFYNKIGFLRKRYTLLYNECINRGIKVSDFSSAFDNIPKHLDNDWTPSPKDISIIQERINDRLSTMKTKPRFR